MTTTSRPPTARLRTPGDLAATVPALCGFHPRDSVVVISLRGSRRRIGLTMRVDLPPGDRVRNVARTLLARVRQDGGRAAVVTVFCEGTQHPDLVEALAAAGEAVGAPVVEAVHVAAGRWTSYLCAGACCPTEGTPVGEAPALLRAEQALDGRVVLGSREELVRSLAAPDGDAFLEAVAAARSTPPTEPLQQVAAALDEVAQGGSLDLATAARVGVLLHEIAVRDAVVSWALERGDAVLALAEQVARLVGPPEDAPVCAVLAWVAYARGDGARAAVAVDRALHTDPGYALARLLQAALDGALPPAVVREAMRAAR